MAGHSKWANIKHKKAASDKKKGRIFSRLAKEIMVSVRTGGTDPDANTRLRTALASARSANMPNANIERAIKKGSGESGGADFEEIVYEGYGPEGVAVMVECLTDNRNRTAGEVRMVFDRSGGNLAGSGAVMWMFNRKARFIISGENADEEKLMEITMDAGAENISVEDDIAEITGPVESFENMAEALEKAGIKTDEAGLSQVPDNTVEIKELSSAKQVIRLMDALEDLDDVQAVHSNFDIPDEISEQLED